MSDKVDAKILLQINIILSNSKIVKRYFVIVEKLLSLLFIENSVVAKDDHNVID